MPISIGTVVVNNDATDSGSGLSYAMYLKRKELASAEGQLPDLLNPAPSWQGTVEGWQRIAISSRVAIQKEYARDAISSATAIVDSYGSGGGAPVVTTLQDSVDFAFDTPSPLQLIQLQPGDVIVRAVIVVDTIFFRQGQPPIVPTVTLGTAGTPDLLFAANESDLKTVGQYEYNCLSKVVNPDWLQLVIAPDACTQGAGSVLYEILR